MTPFHCPLCSQQFSICTLSIAFPLKQRLIRFSCFQQNFQVTEVSRLLIINSHFFLFLSIALETSALSFFHLVSQIPYYFPLHFSPVLLATLSQSFYLVYLNVGITWSSPLVCVHSLGEFIQSCELNTVCILMAPRFISLDQTSHIYPHGCLIQ